MSAITDYRVDIVARTKELLLMNHDLILEKDREVTFLMNCLLGLVVAVSEQSKQNRSAYGTIDADYLALIPEKIGFLQKDQVVSNLIQKDLTRSEHNIAHKRELMGRDKYWFINRLRNCIAHQNIYGVNANDKWIGVKLWNIRSDKIIDFEVVFTTGELRKLAIRIADEFLARERPKVEHI
jgi:hypothetical protein